MNRLISLKLNLLLWLFSSQHATSQGTSTYINPGIKLGYTFGENGGFTAGVEISYTWVNENLSFGIVTSADVCKKLLKFHLGTEASTRGIGVCVGPSLTKNNDTTDYGLTFTTFFGLVVIPYYSYTFRFIKDDVHELGSFLKFPIQVSGERLRFGH